MYFYFIVNHLPERGHVAPLRGAIRAILCLVTAADGVSDDPDGGIHELSSSLLNHSIITAQQKFC